MNNLDTPTDFQEKGAFGGISITYSNLMEISQGGPVTGTICINETFIPKFRFGGPVIFHDGAIYAPVFWKKFLGFGFKLAKIVLPTFEIFVAGNVKPLIFLDRIEGSKIIYFKEMEKENSGFYSLHEFKERIA